VGIPLAKAHGLGNDFLLVAEADAPEDKEAWARRLCDRHTGIGADGVVLFSVSAGVATMHLRNADGTRAEISGNGLRCLSAHLVRRGALPGSHVVVTEAGPRSVDVRPLGGGRYSVTADLGLPILESGRIPVALDPPAPRVVDHPLEVLGGTVHVTALSLGNPHCVVFRDAPVDDETLLKLGAALECHPFFPKRTNVEFTTLVGRGELRMRIYERGVGYTRASGTGSASAACAAILARGAERSLRVHCDGGDLDVLWEEGRTVRQTGDVEVLFEGEWVL
jgi:diaminopimelate epimerase